MQKTLVVAKYKEDVSWTETFMNKGWVVIVIDKSNGSVPNVGREAETYLRFITENYRDLTGYLLFCQGNPHEHYNNFNSLAEMELESELLFLSDNKLKSDVYGLPDHHELNLNVPYANMFYGPVPSYFVFYPGAQFMVKSELVLRRSLFFYERLHKYVCRYFWGPWVLERFWPLIFDASVKDKYQVKVSFLRKFLDMASDLFCHGQAMLQLTIKKIRKLLRGKF